MHSAAVISRMEAVSYLRRKGVIIAGQSSMLELAQLAHILLQDLTLQLAAERLQMYVRVEG